MSKNFKNINIDTLHSLECGNFSSMMVRMKNIYLDNAATTQMDKDVRRAMLEYGKKHFANPSSIHKEGVFAREEIDSTRDKIADFFDAHSDEIVFTSGGTESDNLAIIGVIKAFISNDKNNIKPHIITSVIEHPAVLETCIELEKNEIARVTYLPVSESGYVAIDDVKDALCEDTALVSIMHANNEIGTVQPIKEITKVVRDFRKGKNRPYPLMHTDACQSANYLNIRVPALGVDLLTANSSKIYGPKGVGVLFVKRGTPILPILFGGGQENGLRAGTENVEGIIGAGEAFHKTKKIRVRETDRMFDLREYFLEHIKNTFPDAIINGGGVSGYDNADPNVIPNIVNVSFPGFSNEEIVLRLDAKGIAVSAKSACKSRNESVSYVVYALGGGHYPEFAVRFSMGRFTSKKDIDYTIEILREVFNISIKIRLHLLI